MRFEGILSGGGSNEGNLVAINYRRPYFVLSLVDQPLGVLTTRLIMSMLSQAITTTNFQVN